MKLFEMKKMPEKAGDAIIEFNSYIPSRKKEKITLSDDPDMDFFWLNHGLQFLIYYYTYCENKGSDLEKKKVPVCWFGGMDESPFLVRLRPWCYHTLITKGEAAFFNALKPERIKNIEKLTNQPAQRQGDIFSVKIPFSLEQLEMAKNCLGGKTPVPKQKNTQINLFETRHKAECKLSSSENKKVVVVKEAILKAPDHHDLELPDIHLIEQAVGLYDPQRAD